MKSIKKLWKILDKKEKLFFFIILFFFLVQALLEIVSLASIIPFITALLNPESLKEFTYFKYFEKLLPTKNLVDQLPLFAFIFFLFFLIKSISLILIYKIIFQFVYKLKRNVLLKILKKYLHQNYLYFIKNPFSKLSTNINNEIQNFVINFVHAFLILLSELIIFCSIIFLVILSGNIKAILFLLPFVFLIILIIKRLNKNIKKWTENRVFNERQANSNFFQIILGIKEVILIGKIKKLLKNFEKIYQNLAQIVIKQSIIQTLPRPILEVFAIGTFVVFLLFFYYEGIPNKEIIVILSFYLAVSYRLLPSMNKIFVHYQKIKFGKVSLNIIYDDIKLEDKLIYEIESKNKLNFDKNIELKNICFGFNKEKNILKNIDFKLNKNEIIGFYGESGSGKSTFLNIFCSLIKPNSGKILLDQNEISDKITIRKFQNLISFISQDTFLLDDTIKNNILFGSEKIFDEKNFENALEFSRVNIFLKELPDGIDTVIGTNSKKISSGQKQRIAIARLVYNAREILIFDEATNALDEYNEKQIINNIMNLKSKKTVVIVSHNKNNLKLCDKIYEIKNESIILK